MLCCGTIAPKDSASAPTEATHRHVSRVRPTPTHRAVHRCKRLEACMDMALLEPYRSRRETVSGFLPTFQNRIVSTSDAPAHVPIAW